VRNGHSFLGQWYETAEDLKQAKHYYGLAAALGDTFATDRLKFFDNGGVGDDT
jgi:TPR repeat protein